MEDDRPSLDLATLAYDALQALRDLTPRGVIRLAMQRVDEPWVRETFDRHGDKCTGVVGVYNLTGSDDITLWPAAVVRVTRNPWKFGQTPRQGYVGLYLSERGEWAAVYFDGLREERRRCGWPIPEE